MKRALENVGDLLTENSLRIGKKREERRGKGENGRRKCSFGCNPAHVRTRHCDDACALSKPFSKKLPNTRRAYVRNETDRIALL